MPKKNAFYAGDSTFKNVLSRLAIDTIRLQTALFKHTLI